MDIQEYLSFSVLLLVIFFVLFIIFKILRRL